MCKKGFEEGPRYFAMATLYFAVDPGPECRAERVHRLDPYHSGTEDPTSAIRKRPQLKDPGGQFWTSKGQLVKLRLARISHQQPTRKDLIHIRTKAKSFEG